MHQLRNVISTIPDLKTTVQNEEEEDRPECTRASTPGVAEGEKVGCDFLVVQKSFIEIQKFFLLYKEFVFNIFGGQRVSFFVTLFLTFWKVQSGKSGV